MPAAFRLYSKLEPQWGSSRQLLTGGYFKFYTAGTLTPKDVYGEKALTTNNGSTVLLDASGRPNVDIWGSGSYFVELYDSDDVKQGEADNVEIPGGDATVLPVLQSGEYLSGDGSGNYIAVDLSNSLLPDQTGHSNEVLGTDGSTASWIAKPADGTDGADGTSDLTAVGLDGKTIRTGSATGTNAGDRTQSVSVTYATALGAAADFIGITVTNASLSSYGNSPSWRFTASSTTGFTVVFTMGELDDSQSGFDFNAGVAFRYWAIGTA